MESYSSSVGRRDGSEDGGGRRRQGGGDVARREGGDDDRGRRREVGGDVYREAGDDGFRRREVGGDVYREGGDDGFRRREVGGDVARREGGGDARGRRRESYDGGDVYREGGDHGSRRREVGGDIYREAGDDDRGRRREGYDVYREGGDHGSRRRYSGGDVYREGGDYGDRRREVGGDVYREAGDDDRGRRREGYDGDYGDRRREVARREVGGDVYREGGDYGVRRRRDSGDAFYRESVVYGDRRREDGSDVYREGGDHGSRRRNSGGDVARREVSGELVRYEVGGYGVRRRRDSGGNGGANHRHLLVPSREWSEAERASHVQRAHLLIQRIRRSGWQDREIPSQFRRLAENLPSAYFEVHRYRGAQRAEPLVLLPVQPRNYWPARRAELLAPQQHRYRAQQRQAPSPISWQSGNEFRFRNESRMLSITYPQRSAAERHRDEQQQQQQQREALVAAHQDRSAGERQLPAVKREEHEHSVVAMAEPPRNEGRRRDERALIPIVCSDPSPAVSQAPVAVKQEVPKDEAPKNDVPKDKEPKDKVPEDKGPKDKVPEDKEPKKKVPKKKVLKKIKVEQPGAAEASHRADRNPMPVFINFEDLFGGAALEAFKIDQPEKAAKAEQSGGDCQPQQYFQCPFRFKCPFERTNQANMCQFLHEDLNNHIVPVPRYVCVPFVFNEQFTRNWCPPSQLTPCRDVTADRCYFGLHMTRLELDRFEEVGDNRARIREYLESRPDDDYKCITCNVNIVLERRAPQLQEYAIFSGCDHVHCAQCVRWAMLFAAPRCEHGCEGADRVIFQYYEPKIRDRALKQKAFEGVVPELVPQWLPARQISKLLDSRDILKKVYAEQRLGELYEKEQWFLESIRVNLENKALFNAVYQIINNVDRMARQGRLEFGVPRNKFFCVPEALSEKLSFSEIMEAWAKADESFFDRTSNGGKTTFIFKWKPSVNVVLSWRDGKTLCDRASVPEVTPNVWPPKIFYIARDYQVRVIQ